MIKVLLRRNVTKLGQIGDVVEVKDGYARNYLIPHGIAMSPSEANLKAIEAERQAYLAELAKQRAVLEQRAKMLDGKEFTISARANEEGHLYGSVGPAQIAAVVNAGGIIVEPENIVLDEPIRRLDKYEVPVAFDEDVRATVAIWVVPPHDDETGDGQPEPAGGDEPPPTDAPDDGDAGTDIDATP